MSKYKAVLFDYDGTLMDTNELIIESWQHMARQLIGHELSQDEMLSTFGLPLVDAMEEVRVKYGLRCSADEMCDMYRSYQYKHVFEQRHPFEGTEEMLSGIQKKGIKIGIVTSRFIASTEEGLKQFDLLKYFDAIIGVDDTDIHKPNPEPAILCCNKLNVAPNECLMVGDSVFDLQCGHNAGTDACFVTWSMCTSTEKAAAEASPEYKINTPQELINLV